MSPLIPKISPPKCNCIHVCSYSPRLSPSSIWQSLVTLYLQITLEKYTHMTCAWLCVWLLSTQCDVVSSMSEHRRKYHLFLQSNNIPVCEFATFPLSVSQQMDIWVDFILRSILSNAGVCKFMYKILYWHVNFSLSYTYYWDC